MKALIKRNEARLKNSLVVIGMFMIILCGLYVKEPHSHISQYITLTIIFLLVNLSYRKKGMFLYSKICLSASAISVIAVIYELIKLLK